MELYCIVVKRKMKKIPQMVHRIVDKEAIAGIFVQIPATALVKEHVKANPVAGVTAVV